MEQCIASALNKQILAELDAASLYLQMSSWLEGNGLKDFGGRLRRQAHEEAGHAVILFNFLKERDAATATASGSVRRREHSFASVKDVMDRLLAQGKHISANVAELIRLARGERDADAAVLLAWFSAVQLEEEEMVTNLLLRVSRWYRDAVGKLRDIDAELAKRQGTIPALLNSQKRHGVA